MELRVLNYFIAIVQEKNITKAAEKLHLSQPTLSRQIKDLEEEIGDQLFIRGNREVILTEKGDYLYNHAKEIIKLVDKTAANLMTPDVMSGEVFIGSGESQAMRSVSDTLFELHKIYPEIKMSLYSGNADEIMQKLDAGTLDFGFVINPTDKQKYDTIKISATDTWGLLVNRANPLANQKTITPADIKREPLLVSQQSLVSHQISEWLGDSILNYQVIATYNLLFNASLFVKSGTGSALAISDIINTNGTNLTFIPLEPKLESSLSLIWKKNTILSNAAQKFLEKLIQQEKK
ncbi:LysR family transcriptional regulator [Dellaglioa sp. BT-FLS60]